MHVPKNKFLKARIQNRAFRIFVVYTILFRHTLDKTVNMLYNVVVIILKEVGKWIMLLASLSDLGKFKCLVLLCKKFGIHFLF